MDNTEVPGCLGRYHLNQQVMLDSRYLHMGAILLILHVRLAGSVWNR
jgi:hypothetical protein